MYFLIQKHLKILSCARVFQLINFKVLCEIGFGKFRVKGPLQEFV